MKKLAASFGYAFNGFRLALKSEQNLRTHAVVAIIVIIAGFIFGIDKLEWLAILLCIGLVFSTELLNTAIEKLCDNYTLEMNEGIKRVKDISAAAVVFSVIISVVCGIIIFLPYLLIGVNT